MSVFPDEAQSFAHSFMQQLSMLAMQSWRIDVLPHPAETSGLQEQARQRTEPGRSSPDLHLWAQARTGALAAHPDRHQATVAPPPAVPPLLAWPRVSLFAPVTHGPDFVQLLLAAAALLPVLASRPVLAPSPVLATPPDLARLPGQVARPDLARQQQQQQLLGPMQLHRLARPQERRLL